MKEMNCFGFASTGYRSVPLKNGYSEDLELASLLVYISVQQAGVSNAPGAHRRLCHCGGISVICWLGTYRSESGGGAVLVFQPAEEEAGRAGRTLPVRHTQQPSAILPGSAHQQPHEEGQHWWKSKVSLKSAGIL